VLLQALRGEVREEPGREPREAPMKLLILPFAAAMALASCATPAAPASDVAVSGAKPGKATAPKPKPYPLKKCLVTGDDLDEFEERVSVVHGGQTYEFCCKP